MHLLTHVLRCGRYYEGRGVDQNFPEAFKWFQRAAEQGFPPAHHNLGLMYDHGHGVEQDYGKAAKFYEIAAEKGISKAQYYLALMLANGLGVEHDYGASSAWLHRAVDLGCPEAQYSLAHYYEIGLGGTAQSSTRAEELYNLAANQGLEKARVQLARIRTSAAPPKGTCAHCRGKNSRFRCSQCKVVSYCSRDCQREHWKSGHRQVCNKPHDAR